MKKVAPIIKVESEGRHFLANDKVVKFRPDTESTINLNLRASKLQSSILLFAIKWNDQSFHESMFLPL